MELKAILKRLEVKHEGGTVSDKLINNDIRPIEKGRRLWTFWTYHNLWVLTNTNISSYMVGSSLIGLGLLWWQAIIAIICASIISTVFIVLNSTPGAFYNIGFPVANRYTWGIWGSQFVILNRILLSLVWYAVQAWIGGLCVYTLLRSIWPSLEDRVSNTMPASTGMTTAQFMSYIIFCVISLPIIWIRPHKLTKFFYISAATVLVFEISLFIWSLATMGPDGFGDTISSQPLIQANSTGWAILYGIISCVGGISAGILNQNDYARFARTPRDAILAQIICPTIYANITPIVGIIVTAATQQRYGEPLWSLPILLSAIQTTGGPRSRAAIFFASAALVISQFGINIPGNGLSGGMDFAALFPKYLNIRRGAYLTALVSMVVNPWQLLATATVFLSVLSSYSVFLGPMIGLMISSYYIVNKQRINVDHLYVGDSSSVYWFVAGVNWRAPIAWLCGVAPSFPGFISAVNPSIKVPVGATRLYYICFLNGLVISAVVFVGLHWVWPARRLGEWVEGQGGSWRENRVHFKEKWDALAGEADGDGQEVDGRRASGEDDELRKGDVEVQAESVEDGRQAKTDA